MNKNFDHKGKHLIEGTDAGEIVSEYYGDRSQFPEYKTEFRRRDQNDFRLYTTTSKKRRSA